MSKNFRFQLDDLLTRLSPRVVRNAMMANLFDLCVSVILQSPTLSEKAALYLPQKLSHYILYKACISKKLATVEKLVEAWTYPTLSLDFMSFPTCKQSRESSNSCLLSPEYFSIYSSVELAPCITSIAVGLFNNVYRQVCQRSYSRLQVQEVDMSCIQASLDNGESLRELQRNALMNWSWGEDFQVSAQSMRRCLLPTTTTTTRCIHSNK